MTKHPTTFGLDPQKLGKLLALSQRDSKEQEDVDIDQQKGQIIRDYLSDIQPLTSEVIETLPTLVQQMYKKMPRLEGQSIESLLLSTNTQLNDLELVKNFAKQQVNSAQDEIEYEVTSVVYYAAISAALVYHQQKITSFSYEKLKDLLLTLVGKKWIPTELIHILEQAHKMCKKQAPF